MVDKAGNAINAGRKAHHLTDNNTVAYTAGLRGNAASIVPAGLEFLSRADSPALSTGDIDFTLVANVYMNSTPGVMVIANKGLANSNSRDYVLFYNPSLAKFQFLVGNGTVSGSVVSQQTVTAGQWYTVIAWHDSVNNTLNMQVNNGVVSTVGYSSGAMDSTYPLSIGAHIDGTSGFDGRVDDLALYKRVLTVSERPWIYNNGKGRSYADLTSSNPGMANLSAWWNMNETSSTRYDSFGTSHLTDNNTVSYASGLQGNAARFVPANLEFLSRADSAVLSTGDINFSLVANVYLNSTSNIMVVANKGLQSSSIRDYLLFYNPGNSRFTFSVGNGTTTGAVSSQETVVTGRWYTVIAWHDAINNTLNIQVNNAGVSTVGYASGAMDTTYPLSIGAHADGSCGVDGRIDEVVLYKRVLTSAERSWFYNNGTGRGYADLGAPTTSGLKTYTYGDPTHKHAVTALSTGESYTYDANGNMITRVEGGVTYTQTFDIENRLTSVTVGGQITQFIYDGDGNLVKKIKPDGSRTLYVGGIYEVDKNSGGSVTRTITYYPAAGAMRIDSTLYFVLKDHLGSASVVTDASGTVVGEDRFMPFGETRFTTGTMLTDKLFTGQRQIADLGIYHYGARFYSPYINRFLSADTIVPGYANPQNLNRYSYVMNNPLRYIDPTGHKPVCGVYGEECQEDELDALTGSGNGAGLDLEQDPNPNDKPLEDMKPGDIITFMGGGVTYNYMLGLMDNGALGFWDLDSHAYIPYALAVNMVDGASAWTTFKKVDTKTFNSYEIMNSSSTPFALPEYDVNWTGGMDDNPAYVEIRTQVDWENVPSQFLWAVLGPSLVTSFWGDAKPTVTPLSQAGYYPLTNYVAALAYFANDGAAIARYPVIHP